MLRLIFFNMSLFTLIRLYLAILVVAVGGASYFGIFRSFFVGFIFDAVVVLQAIAPLILLRALVPALWLEKRLFIWLQRVYVFFLVFIFLFAAFGEPFFWDEFKSRFNFIAVDYLIYTNEVLNNIWESYPLGWFLFIVSTLSGLVAYWSVPKLSPKFRYHELILASVIVLSNYTLLSQSFAESSSERPVNELSKNGLYSFFTAYFHNEINYTDFYETRPAEQVISHLQRLIPGSTVNSKSGIHHLESREGSEKKFNVIMVVMESLSAKFMKRYGSTQDITPVLDRLTKESLYFSNILATGTRTVRGLEALTLGLPPTPGQSIVRRPEAKNLFNIGTVFREKGYSTQFIYGGYSYFDNMREFFTSNGFDIVDQGDLEKKEITFANAWGVCDEDIFRRVSKEAAHFYEIKKPFFQLVLTTSNHRPYTYPQKIDIPSGDGRGGAVKYSDYAIGEFLNSAKTQPWFDNTLFVFVSDHNAGLSGKSQIPLDDYTIPVIFYNPKIVPTIDRAELASQIDIAPTILGLLNFKYDNRFFGQDLMRTNPNRAFVSNFQYVGLLTGNELVVLGPKRKIDQFSVKTLTQVTPTSPGGNALEDTIAYYQGAAFLYQNKLLVVTPKKPDRPDAKFKSAATHPGDFNDKDAKYSKTSDVR